MKIENPIVIWYGLREFSFFEKQRIKNVQKSLGGTPWILLKIHEIPMIFDENPPKSYDFEQNP